MASTSSSSLRKRPVGEISSASTSSRTYDRATPTWVRSPPPYVLCASPFGVTLAGLSVCSFALQPAVHTPSDRRDLDSQLLGCLMRHASFPGPAGAEMRVSGMTVTDATGLLSANISIKQPGNYRLVIKDDRGNEVLTSEMFGVRQQTLVYCEGDFPSEWLKDEGPKDKAIEFEVELKGATKALSGAALKVMLGYGSLRRDEGTSDYPSQAILTNLSEPCALGANNKARLRMRISEVSKNHQSRPFCFVVEVDDDPTVAPCITPPVVVKSKRNATAMRKMANNSPVTASAASSAAAAAAAAAAHHTSHASAISSSIAPSTSFSHMAASMLSLPASTVSSSSLEPAHVPAHLSEWSASVAAVMQELETNSKERTQIELRLKKLLTHVPSEPPALGANQPAPHPASLTVSELFGGPPSTSWGGMLEVPSAMWASSSTVMRSLSGSMTGDRAEYISNIEVDVTGSSDSSLPFCIPAFNTSKQVIGAFITRGDETLPYKSLDELIKANMITVDFAAKTAKIHQSRLLKIPSSPVELADLLRKIITSLHR